MNGTRIPGRFTNHSLRTSTVNELQDAGFPDSDVMSRTGHRSVSSIAKYRRSNDVNVQAVSGVLEGNHCLPESSTSSSTNDMKIIQGISQEELLQLLDDDFDESNSSHEKQASRDFNLKVTQLISNSSDANRRDNETQTDVTFCSDEAIISIKTERERQL